MAGCSPLRVLCERHARQIPRPLRPLSPRPAAEPAPPRPEPAEAVAALQQDLAPPAAEPELTPPPPAEPPAKKQGWFQRLKAGLTKTSAKLSEDIAGIFTKRKLDADTLQELEDLLIQADLGVETAMRITETLSKGRYNKEIAPAEVRAVLAAEVERVLAPVAKPLRLEGDHRPHVILVVGVNGTGKTTTIGKLAQRFARRARRSHWQPAIPSAPPPSTSSRSGASARERRWSRAGSAPTPPASRSMR